MTDQTIVDSKTITKTVGTFDLSETTCKTITDSFINCIDTDLLKHNLLQAQGLQVTDETQTDIIKIAGRVRRDLKAARTAIEKKRKELKAYGIRKGKAIESAANLFKNMIEPVEKYLENQEKFAEIQEGKRKDELKATRSAALCEIDPDHTVDDYTLRTCTEEVFEGLKLKAKKDKAEREQFELFKKQQASAESQNSVKDVPHAWKTENGGTETECAQVLGYIDALIEVPQPEAKEIDNIERLHEINSMLSAIRSELIKPDRMF